MQGKIRRWDIRKYLMTWVSAVLVAFSLLGGGLYYSTSELQTQIRQIFFASQSLETNYRFELTVLAETHEDALWRFTRQPSHQQARQTYFNQADAILIELKSQADSPGEANLAQAVEQWYVLFRRASLSSGQAAPTATQALLADLLIATHRHRDHNADQMATTISKSHATERAVDIALNRI